MTQPSTTSAPAAEKVYRIPVDRVSPNPLAHDKQFDGEKLAGLVSSMRKHGQRVPAVVKHLDKGGYEIVDGEHRYRACLHLGQTHYRAHIRRSEPLLDEAGGPLAKSYVPAKTQVRGGKVVPVKGYVDKRTKKPAEKESSTKIYRVPVSKIQPDPHQHRTTFTPASLKELATSMQESGQKTPVVLRRLPEGRFQIIAGERRYRAALSVGMKDLAAVIREHVTDEEALTEQVIENINREQVTPMEEAHAYGQLADLFMRKAKRSKQWRGRDFKDPAVRTKLEDAARAYVCQQTGKDGRHVAFYLKLNDLDPEVQEMVSRGSLSPRHGNALTRLTDGVTDKKEMRERIQTQTRLARFARAHNTAADDLVKMVTTYLGEQAQASMFGAGDFGDEGKLAHRNATKAKIDRLVTAVVDAIAATFDDKQAAFRPDALGSGELAANILKLQGAQKTLQQITDVMLAEASRRDLAEATKRRVTTAPASETGGSGPAGAGVPPAPGRSLMAQLRMDKALVTEAQEMYLGWQGLVLEHMEKSYHPPTTRRDPKTGKIIPVVGYTDRVVKKPEEEGEDDVQDTDDTAAEPGADDRPVLPRRRRAAARPGPAAAGGESGPEYRSGLPPKGILTARADLLPPVDLSACPAEFAGALSEDQVEGTARAITALDKQGGFILADGTGVGKTRQILAVAKTYHDRGYPVLIVAPAEVIKQDWATGQFHGSYMEDGEAVGIIPTLLDGSTRKLGSNEVGITTYHGGTKKQPGKRPLPEDLPPNTIVLFDEAHAGKNATGGKASSTAKWICEIGRAARAVMYASATPMDKAEHLAYLFRAGVCEGRTMHATLESLGLEWKPGKQKINKKTGEVIDTSRWAIRDGFTRKQVAQRVEALFDRITAAGSMLKREVSLDGLSVKLLGISVPDEARRMLARIEERYVLLSESSGFGGGEDGPDMGGGEMSPFMKARMLQDQRRHLEPYKIAPCVELIKQELAEGRNVVVFCARVNDSTVKDEEKNEKGEVVDEVIFAQTAGTAVALEELLRSEGITEVAALHGQATKTSATKVAAQDEFQSGRARVLISTVESGGTGINLDDRIGDKPRTLICLTAPFTAPGIAQMVGRVIRRTTRSDVRVKFLFADEHVDQWNARIANEKLSMLGASVQGEIGARIELDQNIIDWLSDDDLPYVYYNPGIHDRAPRPSTPTLRSTTAKPATAAPGAAQASTAPAAARGGTSGAGGASGERTAAHGGPTAAPQTPHGGPTNAGGGSGAAVAHRIYVTGKGKQKPVYAWKQSGMEKDLYARFSEAGGWFDRKSGEYLIGSKSPTQVALVREITGQEPPAVRKSLGQRILKAVGHRAYTRRDARTGKTVQVGAKNPPAPHQRTAHRPSEAEVRDVLLYKCDMEEVPLTPAAITEYQKNSPNGSSWQYRGAFLSPSGHLYMQRNDLGTSATLVHGEVTTELRQQGLLPPLEGNEAKYGTDYGGALIKRGWVRVPEPTTFELEAWTPAVAEHIDRVLDAVGGYERTEIVIHSHEPERQIAVPYPDWVTANGSILRAVSTAAREQRAGIHKGLAAGLLKAYIRAHTRRAGGKQIAVQAHLDRRPTGPATTSMASAFGMPEPPPVAMEIPKAPEPPPRIDPRQRSFYRWQRDYHTGDDTCPDRACPLKLSVRGNSTLQLVHWVTGGSGYPPEARCIGNACMFAPECSRANGFTIPGLAKGNVKAHTRKLAKPQIGDDQTAI